MASYSELALCLAKPLTVARANTKVRLLDRSNCQCSVGLYDGRMSAQCSIFIKRGISSGMLSITIIKIGQGDARHYRMRRNFCHFCGRNKEEMVMIASGILSNMHSF